MAFMIDSTLIFSDDQAVTATALSTNVVDMVKTGGIPYGQSAAQTQRQLGERVPIVIQCTTAAVSGGSSTVTVTFESADEAAMDTTNVVHFTSGAIPKASLIAGYRFHLDYLPSTFDVPYKRYWGVRYTVATANLTAGTFHAAIQSLTTYNSR